MITWLKLVILVVFLLEIIKHWVSVVSDNSHRAVIPYLSLTGLTPKEIHEDMVVTLGENALSYSTVKKWDDEWNKLFHYMNNDCYKSYTLEESLPHPKNNNDTTHTHHPPPIKNKWLWFVFFLYLTDIFIENVYIALSCPIK